MFDKVDTDGNGKLTPDEIFPIITEMVNEHPLSVTMEHCRGFAGVFDANQDGAISRTEFKRFVEFFIVYETLSSDPQLLEDLLVAQGIIEGQFRMNENLKLLKNNVETVDKIFHLLPDWLKGFLQNAEFGEICNQMFDKVDTDGNGKLTPDELFPIITEMVDEHPLSITMEHCRGFAGVFDANKDGVISRSEFRRFVEFTVVFETLMNDPQLLEDVLVAQGIIEGQFRMDENLVLFQKNVENVDKIFHLLPDWIKGFVQDRGFG